MYYINGEDFRTGELYQNPKRALDFAIKVAKSKGDGIICVYTYDLTGDEILLLKGSPPKVSFSSGSKTSKVAYFLSS
jgi:hypothetical protein